MGMSIGAQVGYWDKKREEEGNRRERRERLAQQFVRRAAACKSLPALDQVAAEARNQHVWSIGNVAVVVQRCNQRLRGGNDHEPVLYTNGEQTVVVSDDHMVGFMKAGRCVYREVRHLTARALADDGFRYAGILKE